MNMSNVPCRTGACFALPVALLAILALGSLTGCPTTGDLPLTQTIPNVNRPPSIMLTSPTASITVEAGTIVSIGYSGEDGEDAAAVTILVDKDQTINNGTETVIRNDLLIGPGAAAGQIQWNTTGVTPGTYFLFATINDGTNAAMTAAGLGAIQIVPRGTNPLSNPPTLQFLEPVANLGVASADTVQLRYRYRDSDSSVKITLLLDKDQNPNNDNVDNPGDPLDPNSNIILLPSGPRLPDDPVVFPDVPGQAPANVDSIEIRTNPRTFQSTPAGAFSTDKLFLFTVDFSKIPVRQDGKPYFLRATINDGANPAVHVYAIAPLTITGLAAGFVDLKNVGVNIAGTKFQGFSEGENLGSIIEEAGDGDNDTVGDFLLGGRFGSPRNRRFAGSAYIIRGRNKLPFPQDTNTNGLPDTRDTNGTLIDFPRPPLNIAPVPPAGQVFLPYQPQNVGRFGGTVSINSVGSFFRGFTIGMPQAHNLTLPPADLQDPDHPNLATAGLTSVAIGDFAGPGGGGLDGVPDIVLGLPFISGAYDYHDDDPCDGNGADYPDGYPNLNCESGCTVDHMFGPRPCNPGAPFDTGMVIIINGANDFENDGTPDGVVFRLFVDATLTGQATPALPLDDEGILHASFDTPLGMRWRGAWFGQQAGGIPLTPPIQSDNQYGRTVARLPTIDNDLAAELLISIPNHNSGQGRVDLIIGQNYANAGFYSNDGCRSLPASVCTPAPCVRTFVATPTLVSFYGATPPPPMAGQPPLPNERFGNARNGGQINQDGTNDIVAGAPLASRDGLSGNGVTYILFTPGGGFGIAELPYMSNGVSFGGDPIPRVEIHGSHNGDHFGEVHASVGDVNGDSRHDLAVASPDFDDDIGANVNAGFVGIIFGDRPLTGEAGFLPEQIGSAALPGVRFTGSTVGARAGAAVANAGDFNQDGFNDFLIASPGESRFVAGEERLGVAYLIFGGTHLINKSFNLSQVGSPQLPGIVILSPYVKGSADEAPLDNVGGVGDVDGDGFDDICIAATKADFVNPLAPLQRRNDAGEVWLIYGSNFGSNKLP